MNLPNKLTILRIVLTPVFLFLFFAEFIPHNCLFALIVFSVASFTDMLDGKIARKYNIITNFGKIADPIADKILTTSILLCFLQMEYCNVWIIILILAREFTVSAIRIVAASQGSVVPANIYGKIKTVSQMSFSILIMIFIVLDKEEIYTVPNLSVISLVLLWITAIFTVISGIIYVKDSTKLIDFTK